MAAAECHVNSVEIAEILSLTFLQKIHEINGIAKEITKELI